MSTEYIHPYNSSICVRPWVHLNFIPNGKVRPCCLMDDNVAIVGDLKTQSLEEIWNSPKMKQLRKEMLEDKKPKWCERCYVHEKAGVGSVRIVDNDSFPEELKKAPFHTDEDGYNNRMDLIHWDFRFSNKCNLKCRSCGPAYSSAWVPDAKKLYGNNDFEKLTKFEEVDGSTNLDFVKKNAKTVKRIYFAGGEPLIMDEHYKVLEMILAAGNKNCKITYNTNLNHLTYKNWNVIDFWKVWPKNKLEIWPSIDEIGERAELVRKGTDWLRVETNLKILVEEGFHIRPNITTGALNVFRLPEILTYFYENKVLTKEKGEDYLNFNINIIDYPQSLHVKALPDSFKQKVKEKLLSFISDFKNKTGFDLTVRFVYVLKLLDEPCVPDWKAQFVDFNKKIDEIRNENIYEVIPELKCMLE
jgi:radical SAM protein with 4Fe4S-binding SPASM domain